MSVTTDSDLTGVSSGGAATGAPRVLGPFVFNHDDAGLNDGIAFYTPTPGDVLLDAWVLIPEAFDGTTPTGDIGTDTGESNSGLLGSWSGGTWNLAVASPEGENDLGLNVRIVAGRGSGAGNNSAANDYGSGDQQSLPGVFITADPVKFFVSQDGTAGGTAVGGTAGIAHVYIVVATPVVP